jgi:hypothetical protein
MKKTVKFNRHNNITSHYKPALKSLMILFCCFIDDKTKSLFNNIKIVQIFPATTFTLTVAVDRTPPCITPVCVWTIRLCDLHAVVFSKHTIHNYNKRRRWQRFQQKGSKLGRSTGYPCTFHFARYLHAIDTGSFRPPPLPSKHFPKHNSSVIIRRYREDTENIGVSSDACDWPLPATYIFKWVTYDAVNCWDYTASVIHEWIAQSTGTMIY